MKQREGRKKLLQYLLQIVSLNEEFSRLGLIFSKISPPWVSHYKSLITRFRTKDLIIPKWLLYSTEACLTDLPPPNWSDDIHLQSLLCEQIVIHRHTHLQQIWFKIFVLQTFSDLFIWEAERMRCSSHSLAHSPTACYGWSQERGTQSKSPVCGAGSKLLALSLVPPRICVSRKLQSSWVVRNNPGTPIQSQVP